MIRLLILAFSSLCLVQQANAAPAQAAKNVPERAMEQATVHARNATEAMRKGQWSTARDQWQMLLKVQPNSAAALANLGAVEVQLKELSSAATHLEAAVLLKPNLASAWVTLGMLQHQQNKTMLAISSLSRAVFEDPNDARNRNALSIVLRKAGWTRGAELELQKAVDLDPNNAEAHFNLALLYLDQKPPALESAKRHYLRAKDLGTAADELIEKQLNLAAPTPAAAPPAAAKPAK